MGAQVIKMTKSQLDDWLKSIVGPVAAEVRKDSEARAKELMERGKAPGFIDPAAAASAGERKELKPGALAARSIICAVAQKHGANPLDFASKRWGKGSEMAPLFEALEGKSLATGDFGGAGALLGETISSDFIELLRARTLVRALGAQYEPMPTGTAVIGRQTGATTASYVGEPPQANATKPAFGDLRLTAKTLIAKVGVRNNLLRYSSANLEERVTRDAVTQCKIREDLAFIRGEGTEHTPRGLRHWASSANVIPVNATVNHQNVTDDLASLELALEEANAPMLDLGWMMAPRSEKFLKTLLTADGHYAFRAEMLAGTLSGAKYGSTTQIPKNLGGGTNESEIYLVDFSEVLVGEALNMQITASSEASYTDENGNLVSAFDRDETVIRIQMEHDLVVRHQDSVAVLTEVDWGA